MKNLLRRQEDQRRDDEYLKTLRQALLFGAFLLFLGIGVDLPWLEKNMTGILMIRGAMIFGAVLAYYISGFCQKRICGEILLIGGILSQVTGMAVLGWIEGIYLTGYISAVFQTLAFVAIFIPLRMSMLLLLITIVGILWFVLFPAIFELSLEPRLLLSHFYGYLTFSVMVLGGNYFFFGKLRMEKTKQAFLESKARRLKELVIRDGLTGIYNYRHFQNMLSVLLDEAQEHKKPLCLCLIDLDNFKVFNDEAGHSKGNIILQHVARCFVSAIRQEDAVFRIGGDEFAIILSGTSIHDAIQVAKRIQSILGLGCCGLEDNPELEIPPVSCSVGIAQNSPELRTTKAIIEAADQALYQVKNKGGNDLAIFNEDI